jgi:hypothetical protein
VPQWPSLSLRLVGEECGLVNVERSQCLPACWLHTDVLAPCGLCTMDYDDDDMLADLEEHGLDLLGGGDARLPLHDDYEAMGTIEEASQEHESDRESPVLSHQYRSGRGRVSTPPPRVPDPVTYDEFERLPPVSHWARPEEHSSTKPRRKSRPPFRPAGAYATPPSLPNYHQVVVHPHRRRRPLSAPRSGSPAKRVTSSSPPDTASKTKKKKKKKQKQQHAEERTTPSRPESSTVPSALSYPSGRRMRFAFFDTASIRPSELRMRQHLRVPGDARVTIRDEKLSRLRVAYSIASQRVSGGALDAVDDREEQEGLLAEWQTRAEALQSELQAARDAGVAQRREAEHAQSRLEHRLAEEKTARQEAEQSRSQLERELATARQEATEQRADSERRVVDLESQCSDARKQAQASLKLIEELRERVASQNAELVEARKLAESARRRAENAESAEERTLADARRARAAETEARGEVRSLRQQLEAAMDSLEEQTKQRRKLSAETDRLNAELEILRQEAEGDPVPQARTPFSPAAPRSRPNTASKSAAASDSRPIMRKVSSFRADDSASVRFLVDEVTQVDKERLRVIVWEDPSMVPDDEDEESERERLGLRILALEHPSPVSAPPGEEGDANRRAVLHRVLNGESDGAVWMGKIIADLRRSASEAKRARMHEKASHKATKGMRFDADGVNIIGAAPGLILQRAAGISVAPPPSAAKPRRRRRSSTGGPVRPSELASIIRDRPVRDGYESN